MAPTYYGWNGLWCCTLSNSGEATVDVWSTRGQKDLIKLYSFTFCRSRDSIMTNFDCMSWASKNGRAMTFLTNLWMVSISNPHNREITDTDDDDDDNNIIIIIIIIIITKIISIIIITIIWTDFYVRNELMWHAHDWEWRAVVVICLLSLPNCITKMYTIKVAISESKMHYLINK